MGLITLLSYWTQFPQDQLRYAVCLFGLYPLCLLYSWLASQPLSLMLGAQRTRILRHLFSVCFGLSACVYCFGVFAPFHSLFTALVVYAIAKWYPKRAGNYTMVFAMGYLFLLHVHRMWTAWLEYTVDISGVQMLLTIKLTSFAYEYSDSSVDDKPKSLPDLLGWYGYIYFFPSFLVGPTLSYHEYETFIDKADWSNDNDVHLRRSLEKLLPTMTLLVIMYFGMYFPTEYMTTADFGLWDYRTKLAYLMLSQFIVRCKYYFVWSFAHACYLASGANKCVKFDGCNVNIYQIETSQSIYEVTNNWNLCTNEWLKTHMYQRALTSGYSKQNATYITNMVSALWHGFYPGYILTFVTGGVLTELGRRIRNEVRPTFLATPFLKRTYDIICTFVVMILIAYATIPFQLYALTPTFQVWANMYFVGHILMMGAVVLLVFARYAHNNFAYCGAT